VLELKEEEGDDIDENDPLWQAVLAAKGGDRSAAKQCLEDPDSMMLIPEVQALLMADTGGGDDWEKGAEEVTVAVEEVSIKEDATPPGVPAHASAQKAAAAAPPMPPAAEEEEAEVEEVVIEESDPREHLNLVFIGHVDAGKSTLSGSILYVMDMVDKRTIERYEKEAKDRNRESWFLAFIMDTGEEERAKGKTVEVGRAHFDTEVHRYTILDAPGHKNYVPNMISGAAQADVGVLVISARRGEFETGFEKGGQTREHALLAKTLGVKYLVVVINKMDDPTVNWDQERFDECVTKLKPFLKTCGYAIKKEVRFLPISGLSGDNIKKEVSPEVCPWWKGLYTSEANSTSDSTLLACLDNLSMDGRDAKGPLRVPVLDRYYERGCVVLGKVESGTLRVGDEITMAPTNKSVKVDSISIAEKNVLNAKPGENVLLKMNMPIEDVQKGFVLCKEPDICPAVTDIKVQLALVDMLDHRPLFTPGYEAMMHVHTAEVEIVCKKLVSVQEKGREIVRPFARQGQVCTCIFRMPISTCMDTYDNMPAIGRFSIRDEGKTIGIGKILGMKR
jgi:peptide chain release factor subunit 3